MVKNFGIKPIKIKPIKIEGFGQHVKEHKRRPIDKNTRSLVWQTYIGKSKPRGKCYCCKTRIIYHDDYQVGHNKAKARGGSDHISNLRPICGPCNRGMRTMTIEQYKRKYFGAASRKLKKVKRSTKKQKPAALTTFVDIEREIQKRLSGL